MFLYNNIGNLLGERTYISKILIRIMICWQALNTTSMNIASPKGNALFNDEHFILFKWSSSWTYCLLHLCLSTCVFCWKHVFRTAASSTLVLTISTAAVMDVPILNMVMKKQDLLVMFHSSLIVFSKEIFHCSWYFKGLLVHYGALTFQPQ